MSFIVWLLDSKNRANVGGALLAVSQILPAPWSGVAASLAAILLGNAVSALVASNQHIAITNQAMAEVEAQKPAP